MGQTCTPSGCVRGGGRDAKAEKSKAFGDYMRALDAVREGRAPSRPQGNEGE